MRRVSHSSKANAHTRDCACAAAGGDQLRALILDCDGKSNTVIINTVCHHNAILTLLIRLAQHCGNYLRHCAGVIVESEDLHREAYNTAFAHFKACIGKHDVIDWSEEFYDDLQNKVGGGKAKMRWYFGTAPFWWLAWSYCVPQDDACKF